MPVYEQQCTFDGGYSGSTFSKLSLQWCLGAEEKLLHSVLISCTA